VSAAVTEAGKADSTSGKADDSHARASIWRAQSWAQNLLSSPTMDVERWIGLILLGGLAGALGQVGRVIVGLKKVSEEAAAAGKATNELIEPARLFISIAIGFTAGALAAVLTKGVDGQDITPQQILGFAGAGYTGADFVEGAMRSVGSPSSAGATTTASVSNDGYVG
jgi:hypothetical protein